MLKVTGKSTIEVVLDGRVTELTLQQAIKVEVERYLTNCTQAAFVDSRDEEGRAKYLKRAHVHYRALIRLRKYE